MAGSTKLGTGMGGQKQPSDELPSVKEVVDMTLAKAINWCYRLGIDCDDEDLQTVAQCKERLLKILMEKGIKGQSKPVLQIAAQSFVSFKEKRKEFVALWNKIKGFVDDPKIFPYLQKLGLTHSGVWMTEDNFLAAKELCTRGKPMVLVAGSTSSGKSTLVNALIGRPVLPTSYNAATSTLCEIKQGPERKALVHLRTLCSSGDDASIVDSLRQLDISNEADQKTFVSFVNPARGQEATAKCICRRAEVFWPSEFLKDFTLIDSPGVSENDDMSPESRQITEQCQRDTACGFIYVMDATQPAEVAAQVGGLLVAMARGMKTSPAADSALFVLNKWDQFTEKWGRKEAEKAEQEYLKRLHFELGRRWRGFKPYQVIKMNSKLAGLAQELGVLTNDMENLCEGIANVLPRGMNNMILKALKKPIDLLDRIEQTIQGTIREFKLPKEQRTIWRDENISRLSEFKESLAKGKMAEIRRQLDEQIDCLTNEVADYLQSQESIAEALNWDKMTESKAKTLFDEREVQNLIGNRLSKGVSNHPKVKQLVRWAKAQLGPDIEEEFQRLVSFSSEIFTAKPSLIPVDENYGLADVNGESGTSALRIAAIVGAIVTAPISAPIYAIVKLIGLIRDRNFRKVVETAYKEAVKKISGQTGRLWQSVKSAVLSASFPARLVYEEFERMVAEIDKELKARAERREEDLPFFKTVLKQCVKLIGETSSYMLELGIEDYGEMDIMWPVPRNPIDEGVFGLVYKVGIADRKEAALKILKDPISSDNAEDFLRELVVSRKLTGRESHVVEFYGLVRVEEHPLKLGLAFEWCGGGNLADEMFDRSTKFIPGRNFKGYINARRILLEIFSGIKFLHSDNLVHRDLKPENILLTDNKRVRIADLGLAKNLEEITGTQCGTVLYMAPEVMIKSAYSTPADLFSVGIIMWELWHGKRAYIDTNDPSLAHPAAFAMKVLMGNFRPKGFALAEWDGQGVNPNAAAAEWEKLMKGCWHSDPLQRPKAKEAHAAVEKLIK
eukprot:m.251114 g.251114  ORF g.251114 m.251114 type:complete len:1013 (+) comp40332_c0_seq8:194-3232(+)